VVTAYRQWISLYWPSQQVSATSKSIYSNRVSYMLSLERVMFGEAR
jgi:hypothetical protein